MKAVRSRRRRLICNQSAAASILNHLRHQFAINPFTALGITINERLFAILIDETQTDKIAGNTQPERRLKSAGGWHSVGLGSFRFLFYCIHMGVCLVFARFLSITFQRLALR
jgi:hypothetical protein